MIHFEDDDRTHGEALVLRAILRGHTLEASAWVHLCPEDFSNDLHGRIYRHAMGLKATHINPDPAAVFDSMRKDRAFRAPVALAQYLDYLANEDLPLDPEQTIRSYLVFHGALLKYQAAREAAKAAKVSRP